MESASSISFSSSLFEDSADTFWEDDPLLSSHGIDPFSLDCEDLFSGGEVIDNSQRLINFQDYTLNSPLISDELVSFIGFLRTGKSNPLFSKPLWEKRRKWIQDIGINHQTIQDPNRFHSFVAKAMLRDRVTSKLFNKIIVESDNNAKKTHEVLRSYIQGWIKFDVPFQSRAQNDPVIVKYGSYMIDLLLVTWILNAASSAEIDTLTTEFKLKLPPKGDRDTLARTIKTETLGDIDIGFGLVYIRDWSMLLDRNMTLMFKDLATARFHTLFAIRHRQFEKYTGDHEKQIATLYSLGDLVLLHHPRDAYEAFAMVEPITSYRLSELARLHRPKIPTFPHFQTHIDTKVNSLTDKMPEARDFFRHLQSLSDKKILLTAYGAFRHWGHPFIDYLEGLKALHENVNKPTNIDTEYAEKLASDLAYKILHRMYLKNHKWYVDGSLLPAEHPFKEHIKNGTWPTAQTALDYKGGWHKLPLIKCWEVPEVVEPALLYSDKTHSINRDELIEHMRNYPGKSIPTKKVLETFIEQAETNWPKFLQDINDFGLEKLHRVIGLKAKEREIKWKGRFFALMSWKLREYFVFTEYLIKKEIIPLFSGLTMADDQTTLTKKMLENTHGQGKQTYDNVTIANHIDYNKWNNFQRKEATNPVFRVMGQFFGFPNLFTRTHEFFETSLIYYRDRPDLMSVRGDTLVSNDPNNLVCWDGQLGGLEGLRQKGWSVLNLLVIERESKIRNTKVQILAQGDNQVICTMYEIHPYKTEIELEAHITDLIRNNAIIMKRIRDATESIGLFINEDETLQAADMLIYGKNIIYRGNVTCLEEKRYSRVTCTTNDQLPGLGNVMSTVATNCLTVAHYSRSPLNAMVTYNWLANFVCSILHIHNPALRCSPHLAVHPKDSPTLMTTEYLIGLIYLDPSLGGISGMSLSRFHIRMFPDPVTEGLCFWKTVHEGSSSSLVKRLATVYGNPVAMSFQVKHFEKLLEDPNSLNLPRGLSAKNFLKNEVKRILLNHPELIGNMIVRDAVNFLKEEFDSFTSFLESIRPCFPRFVSEYKSATYLGMTESIVGLFENSKTLRNIFKRKLAKAVDTTIVKCELAGILNIVKLSKKPGKNMWECSSSQADLLRNQSWGRRIIGTTVPHPLEMLNLVKRGDQRCPECLKGGIHEAAVVVLIPQGLDFNEDERGPYPPYFGSTTEENTSLIQTWEKTTDISFLRRASNLRRVFSWFVQPSSNLGESIYDNLYKLTGEDPGVIKDGFSRTGSPLHRFGCSRVSAGGFMANNPTNGSRMIVSSDKFQCLGVQNYDFMYQSSMLYAQQTAGEIYEHTEKSCSYHFHISCQSCLREIDDGLELDSPKYYRFPDVSKKLQNWKPSTTPWFKTRVEITLQKGNWDGLSPARKSFELGQIQGFMFSDLHVSRGDSSVLNGLFPIGIRDKVIGYNYLQGVISGLFRGALYGAMKRRLFYRVRDVSSLVTAGYADLVNKISEFGPFLVFCQGEGIEITLNSSAHRIPSSYPTNKFDLGTIVKNYLMTGRYVVWISENQSNLTTWIFADFNAIQLSGMLIIGHLITELFSNPVRPINYIQILSELRDFATAVKTEKLAPSFSEFIVGKRIYQVDREVRHGFKGQQVTHYDPRYTAIVFSNKIEGEITTQLVSYSSFPTPIPDIGIKKIQNPLISGLRVPQLATGSFLKIALIIQNLGVTARGILCGGDGSGGISSYLLRTFPNSRLIFNSLLDMNNVPLGGSLPKPPSAIDQMDNHVRQRCVNLHEVFQNPTDLSHKETWKHFLHLKKQHDLQIDLAIFDMEIVDEKITDLIERNILLYIEQILTVNGTLIVKTYCERLLSGKSCISVIGPGFREVELIQTDWSSSHTSEVYVRFRGFRKKDNIETFPNWTSITRFLEDSYVGQSYFSEFERAQKMMKKDIVSGIPPQFLPSPLDEFLLLWLNIGGDTNSLSRWSKEFTALMSIDPTWTAFCTLVLVFQGQLTICEVHDEKVPVPSDNALEKLFSYYVGTWLYMALLRNDPLVGHRVQALIDTPLQLSLRSVKPGGPTQTGSHRVLEWRINRSGGTTKHIYLGRRMALIGKVIRLFITMSKVQHTSNKSRPFSRLKDFKPLITEETIEKYSDFLYPILKHK